MADFKDRDVEVYRDIAQLPYIDGARISCYDSLLQVEVNRKQKIIDRGKNIGCCVRVRVSAGGAGPNAVSVFILVVLAVLLVVLSGDVELNPGPVPDVTLKAVHDLLVSQASKWNEIGQALKVPHEFRRGLQQDSTRSNTIKLEDVIAKWIESRCSEVSWDHLITVLRGEQLEMVAVAVEEYAQGIEKLPNAKRFKLSSESSHHPTVVPLPIVQQQHEASSSTTQASTHTDGVPVSTNFRPTLQELVECLYDLVDGWIQFAIHLGVDLSTINMIRHDNPHSMAEQRLKVYKRWLLIFPNPTWDHIVEVLERVNENCIAAKLRAKYHITTRQNTDSYKKVLDTDIPTIPKLDVLLMDLVEWEPFAINLPGISNADIGIIRSDYRTLVEQKIAMYDKWLKVYPNASWNNVICALEIAGQRILAEKLQEKYITPDYTEKKYKTQPHMLTAYNVSLLLRDKSEQWYDIGRELGIDLNYQASLHRDLSLTDDDRLEHIIHKWIEESFPVTWESLISALMRLEYNDVIQKIFANDDFDGSLSPHDTVSETNEVPIAVDGSPAQRDTVTKTNEVPMTVNESPEPSTVTETSEAAKKRKVSDYALHLKRAAAKGTVTTRISSLGILGAAGTGKTSLKKLLTYQKADDVYNSTPALQPEKYFKVDTRANDDETTHPQPSEGDDKDFVWDSDREESDMEAAPHANPQLVKLASQNKVIASAGNIWRPATQETLLERIASCVEMVAKQQEESSSNKTKVNADELAAFSMEIRNEPTGSTTISHTNESSITDDSIDASSAASTSDQVPISDEYDEVAKHIIDHVTPENLKQLGITHFVSVSDTGGQAAFMDVAPALLNFNSVNVILLKLNERLQDPARFFYTINGIGIADEARQISTKSLVHSFVSSKSKIQKPRIKGIKVAKPHQKPMFLILGTHFDVYKEMDSHDPMFESKAKKNQLLKNDLSAFKNCIYPNGKKMIFSLDTQARDDNTLELASWIRQLVMENYIQAEIPVAWYIFELAMDKAADSNEGMIFLSTLAKIGNAISEMPPEEVEAALVYFHNLQVCLFYPEVVPNVVFTNPQYLFDKISKIITLSYGRGKNGITDDEFENLTKHGKFSFGLLDGACKPFKECFSSKDFLALLNHLFIISSLPDTDEYFMPCVLAEHPNPCEAFIDASIQVEPLLLTWLDKSVPNGLFPSLTTNIQAGKGFNGIDFKMLDDEQQYRNRITLDCQALACEVTLIECDTFVGIAVRSESLQEIPNTCVDIRKAIFACMNDIVDRFEGRWSFSFGLPNEVFICKVQPECSADPYNIHFCSPTKSPKLLSCGMKSIKTMSSKDSHTIWWGKTGSAVPSLDHSTELTPLNLFHLLRDESSKWDDIGRELKIPSNRRDSLRKNPSISDNYRLEAVLEEWVQQEKTPKWSDFINVLKEHLQFSDVAQQTLTFISTHT